MGMEKQKLSWMFLLELFAIFVGIFHKTPYGQTGDTGADAGKRTQPVCELPQYHHMGRCFCSFFSVFFGMLLGIVFLPETMALPLISVIAVPVWICIGAFYSWLFGFLWGRRERIRVNGDCFLYKGSRLYMLAQITSKAGANVWISNIFRVCLLFSTASFLTGFLMLQPECPFFDEKNRQWMGPVQISLCAVFTVIYFCVLSFQEMKEQQEEEKGILILH